MKKKAVACFLLIVFFSVSMFPMSTFLAAADPHAFQAPRADVPADRLRAATARLPRPDSLRTSSTFSHPSNFYE
jgi:hypothetical protein